MKVLLVEDSTAVIAYVRGVLAGEADLTLLPPVRDGASAVIAVREQNPDVVLMDLELPILDGVEATWEIMSNTPCPIVVLSAHVSENDAGGRTFEALEAGAVEVLAKPRGLGVDEVQRFRRRLVRALRVMSQARLVKRRGSRPKKGGSSAPPGGIDELDRGRFRELRIVAFGSSTGGPPVLYELLSSLPVPYHLPIVVAQHMMPGFEQGFARWLSRTGHPVHVVENAHRLCAGHVYVARGDAHLRIARDWAMPEEADDGFTVPSVDVLFTSVAEAYGSAAAGLLLTGMGTDGAFGLLALRERGGLTVGQSPETCVVDGMPAAARRIGACERVWTPAEMARALRG